MRAWTDFAEMMAQQDPPATRDPRVRRAPTVTPGQKVRRVQQDLLEPMVPLVRRVR
jgi:hypothetical protein